MIKRSVLALGLAVIAAWFGGCGDDSTKTKDCFDCSCDPSLCASLTQKVDVLRSFESAYNLRRIDTLDQVLDANFTFLLSAGDVGSGSPELWDRKTELEVNTRLLDKNYLARPCQSVFMDVRAEDGLSWTAFNPPAAPTETWYSTDVFCDFKFEISPNTYIPPPGTKLRFTVRNAGTDQKPHWQLVELHDLGGAALNAQDASSTKVSTLGSVKMLYIEDGCLECVCNPAMCPPPGTTNLSQKEYVLRMIEEAYNQRNVDWYNGLLDANFTFFLSPGDVNNGLPAQWDRATESGIHARFFDPNDPTVPAQSIFLDLKIEDGVTWISVIPASAPTETWYSTIVYYTYRFEIAPGTYIPVPGSKAQFTVRNAGTNATPHWQLIEMRDLGGASLSANASPATEATTWGSVKAIYRN